MNLTLEDIPPGNDWVLVEVRPAGKERFTPFEEIPTNTQVSFPLGARAQLCYAELGGEILALQGGGFRYAHATTTPVQREPLVELKNPVPEGRYHFNDSFPRVASQQGKLFLLIGVEDPDTWSQAGARIWAQLAPGYPLEWQVAAAGTSTCTPQLSDFPNGSIVSSSVLGQGITRARNVSASLGIDGRGLGIFGVSGSIHHEARLQRGSTTVWEHQATVPETVTGAPSASPLFTNLSAGEYTFEIPRIDGAGSSPGAASYYVLDLPSWAVPALGLEDLPTADPR